MFDTSLVDSFKIRHPELVPQYGHLPSLDLTTHMINYRNAREEQIFGALQYMGMSGIRATSDFTAVNHYLAGRAAQDRILKVNGEDLSLIDVLKRFNLALIAVGGSGSGTMAKWSDFDLMLVGPDEVSNPSEELITAYGSIRAKYGDLLLSCGMTSVDIPFYTPSQFTEDIEDLVSRGASAKRSKDDLQRVTSTLTSSFLIGEDEVYRDFQKRFHDTVKEHSELLITELSHSIKVRHEEYGFSPKRTVPDIKESPGFLRDIDAIQWLTLISKIRDPNYSTGHLNAGEVAALEGASSILLQLKYTLHHDWIRGVGSYNLKQVNTLYPDRVTRAFRTFAAIVPPFADQGRSASRLLYDQVNAVSSILSSTLERVAGDKIIAKVFPNSAANREWNTQLQESLSATPEELLIECLNAIEGLVKEDLTHPGIRSLAVLSLEEQRLIRQIKEIGRGISDVQFLSEKIRDRFVENISDPATAGMILKYLHHCGLLERFLPSFAETNNLSEIGSYLKNTLDLHLIDAVETLGAIKRGELPTHRYLTEILNEVADPLPLILAIVLHDVGRQREAEARDTSPGDSAVLRPHTQIGAEMALQDLKALGLGSIADKTASLIRNHSLLIDAAYAIDPTDKGNSNFLKNRIKSQEDLNQLFLLTFVDKYTSNREAFSLAKQRWLVSVYNHLGRLLDDGSISAARPDTISIPAIIDSTPSGKSITTEEVTEHLALLPKAYARECDPPVIAEHLIAARELQAWRRDHPTENFSRVTFMPSPGESPYLWDLAIVAPDRRRLFVDIAAALYKRNLNIITANIFTRADDLGTACDVFSVCPNGFKTPHFGPTDKGGLLGVSSALAHEDSRERTLISLLNDINDPNTALPEYPKIQGNELPGLNISPKVYVTSAQNGAKYYDLHVECPDMAGLAYLIGRTLWQNDIDIIRAKLGTGNRGIKNIFRILGNQEDQELQDRLKKITTELLLRLVGKI